MQLRDFSYFPVYFVYLFCLYVTGKPERKRPFWRRRRRWEDNIRMVLREMGWEIVDWLRI